MIKPNEMDVYGLWAVTWRSIVLLPFMFVFGMFLLISALGLVLLPMLAAIWAYYHFWAPTLAYALSWLLLVAIWRAFRLWRFFLEGWPSLV